MTWIKTVPMPEGDEKLRRAMEAQRALYPAEYSEPVHPTPDGQSSDIVASHSLIPEALYHAFATFGALMSPELPLTRAQHEMITTVVSAGDKLREELWANSSPPRLGEPRARKNNTRPEIVSINLNRADGREAAFGDTADTEGAQRKPETGTPLAVSIS